MRGNCFPVPILIQSGFLIERKDMTSKSLPMLVFRNEEFKREAFNLYIYSISRFHQIPTEDFINLPQMWKSSLKDGNLNALFHAASLLFSVEFLHELSTLNFKNYFEQAIHNIFNWICDRVELRKGKGNTMNFILTTKRFRIFLRILCIKFSNASKPTAGQKKIVENKCKHALKKLEKIASSENYDILGVWVLDQKMRTLLDLHAYPNSCLISHNLHHSQIQIQNPAA